MACIQFHRNNEKIILFFCVEIYFTRGPYYAYNLKNIKIIIANMFFSECDKGTKYAIAYNTLSSY